MTITTRNEVLVTCQDAPLMELLQNLINNHPEDVDYCLDELGLDYTAASEPREVSTQQEFLDLPLGTVVKIPVAGTYYKTAIHAWTKSSDLPCAGPIRGNDEMANFTISVNAPATILFTPEELA